MAPSPPLTPSQRRTPTNSTKATMMGLPGSLPGARRESDPNATPVAAGGDPALKRPVPQKTMLGMTSPFVAGPPQPLASKPGVDAPGEPSSEATSGTDEPASTPAGSPASGQGATSASASGAGTPSLPSTLDASAKRTMLGVAPPPGVLQAIRDANPALRRDASPAAQGEANPPAKRTMLGVPVPELAASAASDVAAPGSDGPAAAPAPEKKVAAKSARTMLGLAGATPSFPAPDELSAGEDGEAPSFTTSITGERAAPVPPRRRVLAAVVGAAIVLAGFAALWFATRTPELQLRVVQGEEGEQLEIELPSAAPGTKLRFLGNEQELHGGVARFPLSADSLALGENELTIGILRGNEITSTNVRLNVAYRARVELAGLSRDPPALDVVIEALPGSKVSVDNEPLALDARGHGVKSVPIPPQTGSKLAFTARYRVEPKDGPAIDGSLALSLPVTSLQIDRPGQNVTTDQAAIEVAGAVESGAEVLVEGQPVRVTEGRFLHRMKLGAPGEYTVHVLARGQGKAPRAVELKVTRVADLALAAASFKPDPALTYARIAQNPVIYRGQNVAFDGRVYNVEVKAGGSHLQMLARDCPGSQRCPLWVELPQDTDITTDTWVRVLGTVAGEQQFRSERNQVHTVPSVRAQFVLKLAR